MLRLNRLSQTRNRRFNFKYEATPLYLLGRLGSAVCLLKKDNKKGSNTSDLPAIGFTFDGGTLFIEKLGEDEEDGSIILHMVLKNGRVKDSKGSSHDVSLNYTGKFPLENLN